MGLQAAQAAHAAFQFSLEHPAACRAWHEGSNCLVLLTVPNEDDLLDLLDLICDAAIPYTAVTEPDLDGQHTAVAVGPSGFGRRLAHLPLLGRETAMI